MGNWEEPKITINGVELSHGQSMTVRVALEAYAMQLSTDGLGEDPTGKDITQNYLNRIDEVRRMIFNRAVRNG